MLTVEQIEQKLECLVAETLQEMHRDLDEILQQSNLMRKKAEYFRLLSLPPPYREFCDFVSNYFRDKRKSGIKNRFEIAQLYREEFGPWEEEFKRLPAALVAR